MHNRYRQYCTDSIGNTIQFSVSAILLNPALVPFSALLRSLVTRRHLLSAQPLGYRVETTSGHGAARADVHFPYLPAPSPIGYPIPATPLPPLFPHRHEAHNIPHLWVKQRIGKPRGAGGLKPGKPCCRVKPNRPRCAGGIVDPLLADSWWFGRHCGTPFRQNVTQHPHHRCAMPRGSCGPSSRHFPRDAPADQVRLMPAADCQTARAIRRGRDCWSTQCCPSRSVRQ